MLTEFAARAGDGLRKIFAHCVGFDRNGDLLQWMRQQFHRAGRELRQLDWTDSAPDQEKAQLHAALSGITLRRICPTVRSIDRAGSDRPKRNRSALVLRGCGERTTDDTAGPHARWLADPASCS